MEKKLVEKSDDYYEKNNRSGAVDGYLDELLEDIIKNIESALNENNNEKRTTILKSMHCYLNGVQDGNRFNKPNPFNEKNPKIQNPNGSRILI